MCFICEQFILDTHTFFYNKEKKGHIFFYNKEKKGCIVNCHVMNHSVAGWICNSKLIAPAVIWPASIYNRIGYYTKLSLLLVTNAYLVGYPYRVVLGWGERWRWPQGDCWGHWFVAYHYLIAPGVCSACETLLLIWIRGNVSVVMLGGGVVN